MVLGLDRPSTAGILPENLLSKGGLGAHHNSARIFLWCFFHFFPRGILGGGVCVGLRTSDCHAILAKRRSLSPMNCLLQKSFLHTTCSFCHRTVAFYFNHGYEVLLLWGGGVGGLCIIETAPSYRVFKILSAMNFSHTVITFAQCTNPKGSYKMFTVSQLCEGSGLL